MAKRKITQVTVQEMYDALGKAIANGEGYKYLVTSDDNEGNGYHGVFFHLSKVEDISMVSDSQILDPSMLMIIG